MRISASTPYRVVIGDEERGRHSASLIACERDTLRVIGDYDVSDVQQKVSESIVQAQEVQQAAEWTPPTGRRRENSMESPVFDSEGHLLALRGQAESARLEFKQSQLFSKPREKFVEDLSREISAFANTEGGQIVIGIREEKRGKARYAIDIDDGVDPSIFTMEWLQYGGPA